MAAHFSSGEQCQPVRIAHGAAARIECECLAQCARRVARLRQPVRHHPAFAHVAARCRAVAIGHPRKISELAVGRHLDVADVEPNKLGVEDLVRVVVLTTEMPPSPLAPTASRLPSGDSEIARPAADVDPRRDFERLQVDHGDGIRRCQRHVGPATIGRDRDATRLEADAHARFALEALAVEFEHAKLAAERTLASGGDRRA